MRSGMLIVSPFLIGSPAGGNDANARILELNMHHKQQTFIRVKSNERIPRFVVALSVHQSTQRVKNTVAARSKVIPS